MKGIRKKKKKKKGQERHSINLFCFDVFSYKESTRKIHKMIRKQILIC